RAAVDEQAAEPFPAERLDRFCDRPGAAVIRARPSSGRRGGGFARALAILIDEFAQLVDLGIVAAQRSGFDNRQIESEQQACARRQLAELTRDDLSRFANHFASAIPAERPPDSREEQSQVVVDL